MPGKPDARSAVTTPSSSAPSHDADQASELSLERILQNLAVKAQGGNHLLELPVLFLKLLRPVDLGNANTTELLLPPIERLRARI